MSMRRWLLPLTASALLLAGCAKPLPPDKSDYAGYWRSHEMAILITRDGTVNYKRIKGGGNVSVNGPIKEFQGDNFVVGLGPMTTTFVVAEKPHEADGKWKMTIDGVELTRDD